MKILIVDDDEDVRDLLVRAFEASRHSVIAVANGNSALEYAKNYKPDVILSDILMPDMDGYDLCRKIRREKQLKATPFILFSGVFLEQKDIDFALSIGVTSFLKKPIELGSLVREVEGVFREQASTDQKKPNNVLELKSMNQDNHIRLVTDKLYNKVQELSREREALESKEEQLHLITDSLPEMMAEVDMDFRYLYVNKAYAKTFGFLQKTVRGVHVRDVVGQKNYALVRKQLAKAAKGEKVSFKNWFQIEPGNSRYVWFRLIPRTDAAHNVIGVVMFMSDITHLHEVETALHERETLLSSLLSNVPLILFSVNTQGMITVSEGAGLDLLGQVAGKDAGLPASTVYGKHPRMLEYIERALKGEQFETDAVIRKHEFKLIFTPQHDDDRNLVGTICVMIDQSERARLEREVAIVSTLEQKRIGQDLHDSLGQLLTGISLLSKALEGKLSKASSAAAGDAQKISSLASEATRIAKQAVTGLLPVVTEENGLQMALETLANNTVEMYGIPCTLELDDDLPDLDHEYATQVYLILSEAVSNSIKHAAAQKIAIGCRKSSDGFMFSVSDIRSGKVSKQEKGGGKGLGIMKYRSRMIGASLDIDWSDTGTEVSCFMPVLRRQTNM